MIRLQPEEEGPEQAKGKYIHKHRGNREKCKLKRLPEREKMLHHKIRLELLNGQSEEEITLELKYVI